MRSENSSQEKWRAYKSWRIMNEWLPLGLALALVWPIFTTLAAGKALVGDSKPAGQ